MINVKLNDISINITDGKHGDCKGEDKSGYFFISCKDIYDGKIHYEAAREITEQEYVDTHKRTMLEPDDILITNSGTIGRMALVKDAPETYRTTFQKSVAIVKPNKEVVRPAYLYYCLMNCVTQFINQSNGSAQKNLLLGTMREFTLSIEEEFERQDKIVGVLRSYDELIENNQKQINLLEEAAQRLYKEWFIDLRFPGHEKMDIVDDVPAGWHVGTIDEVVCYHDRLRKPLSSIQRSNFKGEYRYYGAAGILDYVEKYLFDGTYLLFGEDGSVITPDGTPVLQYVTGKFWVNNHAHVLTGKAYFTTEYIYMMFKKMGISDVVTGVAQPKISQARLSAKKILIPTQEVVELYQKQVEPIFQRILTLEKQNQLLTQTRDRLLPKLMSGEIEV